MEKNEKLYYTLKITKENINGKYYVIQEKEQLDKKAKYERKMAKYTANRNKRKNSTESLKMINKAIPHSKDLKKPEHKGSYWTAVGLLMKSFCKSHKIRLNKEELKEITNRTPEYNPTKEELLKKFKEQKDAKVTKLASLPYNNQFTKYYAYKIDPNTGEPTERSNKPHPTKPDSYYKTYNQTQYAKTQRYRVTINVADGMKTKSLNTIYTTNRELAIKKAAVIAKSNIKDFCGVTITPPENSKEGTTYFSKRHFLSAA